MTARAAKRRDARERLKGRKVRRGHYDVVVGDGDLPALVAVLDKAEKSGDGAAVEKAQADLAEQVERVWFRAHPDYESLRLANPAPRRTDDDGKDVLDFTMLWPLTPVLAAKCAEDVDLQDVDYWVDELQSWPLPERLGLQAVLIEINTTPANAELAGKAFGMIH